MDKVEIGKRINHIRTNIGDSMTAFGERIDANSPIKSGVVSNWENGIQIPNKKRLKRIAEIGNVSVDYILHGSIIHYIYNNLDFEDNNFNLNSPDKETKLYLSELAYSYIKHKEDFESMEYDKYLQLSREYLPSIIDHFEGIAVKALDSLSKKPREMLETKRQSIIIDKYLNGEEITRNDCIKDFPFLENFKNNNFMFPQEIRTNNFDSLSSILKEYFELYNQLPIGDDEKKNQVIRLKEKSLKLGKIFKQEYDYETSNYVNNDIVEILENKIPNFSDNKINVINKIEKEIDGKN
ncbi:helix-turn-helix transcriptional regulator [Staphylococcus epidermidis]|uniref:helix-turn-helix domain-containing protein n=1 Tax=Staphylococcus epidermidis TaxID=1282 RepID=UPI00138B07C1|nr:helix-turn-helix transcriptional regulator [Staphylococcus epidermidis]MBF2233391.1 helix-turn-helix transcriptional regulator [Staphylococcus epidermidis]